MTAILDQKHYIEELNRHLSGTVTDLQAKMDSVERTNSKLIEEVKEAPCVCVFLGCGDVTIACFVVIHNPNVNKLLATTTKN